MSITIIPWMVVLVFGGVFVFAGLREILRHRAHGPSDNPRDAFEFDESAPSYEEPEVSEAPDEEDPAVPDDASDKGAEDDPDNRSGPDPDGPPRDDTRRKAASDTRDAPDRPDRNEAPE